MMTFSCLDDATKCIKTDVLCLGSGALLHKYSRCDEYSDKTQIRGA